MATVVSKTFSVTNVSTQYLIDGVTAASITVERGGKYVFQLNATGHPMFIQTTGGGYNQATVYAPGVTGNGTQVGSLIFEVPEAAPDTLYYQCQNHTTMYGVIYVIDAQSPQTFLEVDPYSPTIEDLVDKIFYGLKQNPLTSKTSIDTIIGDAPIRLPNKYSVKADDYMNWMWSYNRFVYSYDTETGRLLMEVL